MQKGVFHSVLGHPVADESRLPHIPVVVVEKKGDEVIVYCDDYIHTILIDYDREDDGTGYYLFDLDGDTVRVSDVGGSETLSELDSRLQAAVRMRLTQCEKED